MQDEAPKGLGGGSRVVSSDASAVLIALLFAIAIIPFALTPVVPTIDFYDHVARYFVLADIAGNPFLQRYYAPNWSLLPNVGMDVLGVGVMRFASPLLGAKLLLITILLVQYSGIQFFNRQVAGRYSLLVALLSTPLLYSYIFFWGFANFLFGLGLVFWSAGWWLKMRHRPAIAIPVASVLAVAIFLTHGLAFALYGALLGALEFGLFLVAPNRRLVNLIKSMVALAVQAVIPLILFRMTTTAQSVDGVTNADESVRRLMDNGGLAGRVGELFFYRLQTIVRVAEGPELWFDIATFIATLGLLGALIIRGRISLRRFAWPALALGALLVIVVPPALFGVGYVADRMPLFLGLTLVGCISPQLRGDRFERACLLALAGLVAARIGYTGLDWHRYRTEFADYRVAAAAIPPHSLVSGFNVNLGRETSPNTRCAMFGPMLVSTYGHAAPLFAYATQQPLTLIGPLSSAVKGLPKSTGQTSAAAYYADYIAKAQAGGSFQYLLICNADRLKAPYPAGSSVVTTSGRFTLLRLHPS